MKRRIARLGRPLPALWKLDLASKKGTRLTPKKQFAGRLLDR